MDNRDSLLTIARELRRLAGAAYGKPVRVPVTAGNLRDLADRLERIANAEVESQTEHLG
jgi:hypothetical protein